VAALSDARVDMLSRQAVLVVEAIRQTVAKHWGWGELSKEYYDKAVARLQSLGIIK